MTSIQEQIAAKILEQVHPEASQEKNTGYRHSASIAREFTPTVDGATVDEAAVAAILAAHGWEWGDGLEMLHCDCGWSIDGYIGHEEGLAERDAANAMTEGREVPAVIRHRAHVAQMIAATVPTSPTDTGGTDDGLRAAIEALDDLIHVYARRTGWAGEFSHSDIETDVKPILAVLAAHPAPTEASQ